MFKKIIFIFLFANYIVAQNGFISKPNYDKIEKEIQDKKSKFYFETLLERYLKADSTMTLDEKQHLYYGYAFKNSNHFDMTSREDSKKLNEILSERDSTKTDFKKAIDITDKILKKKYFDLRTLNAQLYVYEKLKDRPKFDAAMIKMNIVIDAIIASGDGKTEESPFYVLEVGTEYDIINILGFQFGGKQRLVSGTNIDYLELLENKYQIKGLYFDVSPNFWALDKALNKK